MTQHHPIRIRPGDTIGQMTLSTKKRKDRSYSTRGRYNGDISVSGAKRSPA